MSVQLPNCPPSLKGIQNYLSIAAEHDQRDKAISYWCRLYALQAALTIDKDSPEAKMLLLKLMDWLEKTKGEAMETISNEMAAQAYIENYALKLFTWADSMDRSGTFNKNVVKSFFSAGLLMDVLTTFGELPEDIMQNRKYAKWKASYINKCLKNGETPVSGPPESENQSSDTADAQVSQNDFENWMNPTTVPSASNEFTSDKWNALAPDSSKEKSDTSVTPVPDSSKENGFNYEKNKVDREAIAKAQKFCKYATSALNYDDVPEAISNLRQALSILQPPSSIHLM